MKKKLILLFFLGISLILKGQVHEIGFFVGGTNYIGDIGSTNYINPNKPGGGLIYKWNWNPRMAVRGTYSFLPIGANDANASTNLKVSRGLKFNNTIHEVAVGLEYNFYEYDMSSDAKYFTPYILIALSAFNYKSAEATGIPNQYRYTNSFGTSIPVGIGFKTRLSGDFAIAVESKIRYTFVDDLDFSTPEIPTFDFGGQGNDWYIFTGFSLVYTFGRPACYSNGL